MLVISLPLIGEGATYQVDNVGEYDALSLSSGDIVEFLGGATFRAQINLVDGVTYRSYGTGQAIITTAIDGSSTGDWADQGSNIWTFDLSGTDVGGDVGLLVYNGSTTAPLREFSTGDLNVQGEFHYSASTLSVYSTSNPGTFYTSIEICPKLNIFNGSDPDNNITISNLDIRYTGSHGVSIVDGDTVIVEDCIVSYCGGATLTGVLRADRYGNGIQLFNSSTDCTVTRNTVHTIFDAGITAQTTNANNDITNTIFSNNIVYTCGIYGFEIFLAEATNDIDGLYIYNNTFYNTAGHGYGNRTERGGDRFIATIGIYSIPGSITDFNIYNNIAYEDTITDENGPTHLSRCIFTGGSGVTEYANIDFNYNCYYRDDSAGQFAYIEGVLYTYAQFSSYQSTESQDTNSIASEPKLTSTYRLKNDSPCVKSGTDLTLVPDDIDSKTRWGKYDIGAYEIPPNIISNTTLRDTGGFE
jgi:hypothetical protein